MTAGELISFIEAEHKRLCSIFSIPEPVAEIKLRVITEEEITNNTPNLVSAHRASENSITIAIPETSLADDYQMRGSPMFGVEPIWKTDILHESIHEYQSKCVTQASEEGRALRQRVGRAFPGDGHDDTFYTAIVECAAKLEVSADVLEAQI